MPWLKSPTPAKKGRRGYRYEGGPEAPANAITFGSDPHVLYPPWDHDNQARYGALHPPRFRLLVGNEVAIGSGGAARREAGRR